MRVVDVALSSLELNLLCFEGKTAVVIDVLRATSTIATALSNGCSAVYPVATIEEALQLRERVPRALLAGERGGTMIKGFDLGNSPAECNEETVGDRPLILTTSNGTPALLACGEATTIFTAALLNRRAVAEACLSKQADVVIACAGNRGGRSSVEDVVCAGAIVEYLVQRESVLLTDGAEIARAMFRQWQDNLEQLLVESAAGQNLQGLGYADDVIYCSMLDILTVVPQYANGVLRLE